MGRTAVFYDGFNFYYGLRNMKLSHGCYYWVDLLALSEKIIGACPSGELDPGSFEVVYFTAEISADPMNPAQREKARCQRNYFNLLQQQGITLIKGSYHLRSIKCKRCSRDPAECVCGAKIEKPTEKQTDVNLGIIASAYLYEGRCDAIVVVSSDLDMAPLAQIGKGFLEPDKSKVYFVNPFGQSPSGILQQRGKGFWPVTEPMLKASVMRKTVEVKGTLFTCPPKWRTGGHVKDGHQTLTL